MSPSDREGGRAKRARRHARPPDPRIGGYALRARRDTLDFRDRLFEATLVEVPVRIQLEEYQAADVPILDQGKEGACTGFGLATVASYLLKRRRRESDSTPVSARMFYEMAKRYDEWEGEDYTGSSARGAMKGWHKHGVCSHVIWPYRDKDRDPALFPKRWEDAVRRPLGAYLRVNHRDIVSMHAALAEVGVLYATANVHEGWGTVGADGLIPYPKPFKGGHAFAIVAYDERGFWIQNSWGLSWGNAGFGLVRYDDWLSNGTDVWVARLGAPIVLLAPEAAATGTTVSSKGTRSYVLCDLRPHIISVGNQGHFRQSGTFGTSANDAKEIVESYFPNLTKNWTGKKRLLLYAHGGLVPEEAAIQRIADYRATFLAAQVYPLAFVWKTDYWTTLKNILEDVLNRRRQREFLDETKDFMLDRLDDALEPFARVLSGKASWDEMKENALLASTGRRGGARTVVESIAKIMAEDASIELHLVGHSAGAIFLAPLVKNLMEFAAGSSRLQIATCTLWAPACTVDLFRKYYLPAIRSEQIRRFALFTLTERAEQDDHCAHIYHKSLLYLVSNAFERALRLPWQAEGQPILGMAKFASELADVLSLGNVDWVTAPNKGDEGSADASASSSHGGFDDDQATLLATLARILDTGDASNHGFEIKRSEAGKRDIRRGLAL